MNLITSVLTGMAGHGLVYHLTKNMRVATATTALIILLLQTVGKASASEELPATVTPVSSELTVNQLLEQQAKNDGNTIFIEYPGLKIWHPVVSEGTVTTTTLTNIEALLEQART